jgi:hypothetical protein
MYMYSNGVAQLVKMDYFNVEFAMRSLVLVWLNLIGLVATIVASS